MIDIAPWVSAYTDVGMGELYSELSLEKLENKPTYIQSTRIGDYKDLFQEMDNEPHDNNSKTCDNKSVKCRGAIITKSLVFGVDVVY